MFPPAPWSMRGQLWLSLFRVRGAAVRPDGVYGAAFVSYEPGSDLTYSELLVARPLKSDEHRRRVSILDIWVDSPESMAGGRELWAIPKGLCDFNLEASHRGPLSRTEWSASIARQPIARASFTDVSKAAVRLPFKGGTWQPALEPGGEAKAATLGGPRRRCPAGAGGSSTPTGRCHGWQASDPSRHSGCATSPCCSGRPADQSWPFRRP